MNQSIFGEVVVCEFSKTGRGQGPYGPHTIAGGPDGTVPEALLQSVTEQQRQQLLVLMVAGAAQGCAGAYDERRATARKSE